MRNNPYRFARNVVLYIALVWLVGQALSVYDHRSHANAEECTSHVAEVGSLFPVSMFVSSGQRHPAS